LLFGAIYRGLKGGAGIQDERSEGLRR